MTLRELTDEEMIRKDADQILLALIDREVAPSNFMQQVSIRRTKGFTCGDHPDLEKHGVYIGIVAQSDCEACGGGDTTEGVVHDFCPVCEFCCGC